MAVAAYAPGEEPARARGFGTGAGDGEDRACGIKRCCRVLGDMLRAEVLVRGAARCYVGEGFVVAAARG